ncbi:MAG TPA: LssY C-terminal domain-containing protein [Pirellulales bacterium]|nr:LssY C-terminal domain-containing protein [Pirellulales bacterium]
MTDFQPAAPSLSPREHRIRRWSARAGDATIALLVVYLVVAYVVLPFLWRHFEHHPAMSDAPKTTYTADRIPGDPLNIALVGSEAEVVAAMHLAGWFPADPTTVRSSVHIAESVVLKRSYETAPVSNLYVWGRPQDLAFEQQEGQSASHRHHVRFWRSDELGIQDRPLWLGAATFDRSVGLSHLTGKVTHHIEADVDSERDHVIDTLSHVGQLVEYFQVTGVGATLDGRNGGGDRYFTDGELTIGVLSPSNAVRQEPPKFLPNGSFVRVKNDAMTRLRPLLK